MKKTGLRDIKKQNMKCILNEFVGTESLSRIELASRTGLSPSTVTTLVSELLEVGLLVTSGEKFHTAGRSRSGLVLNRDYAFSAVFEISRSKVTYSIIDLSLATIERGILTEKYVSGNELFHLLSDTLRRKLGGQRLAGIGLVYVDSSMQSDFSVMYSEGMVSEYISLKNALITAFKVTVIEEYLRNLTLRDMTGESEAVNPDNSIHITLGKRIFASITVDGKTIPLKESFVSDMDAIQPQNSDTSGGENNIPIVQRLAMLISMLCALFPIEVVLFSGIPGPADLFMRSISAYIGIPDKEQPLLREAASSGFSEAVPLLAKRIRDKLILDLS